MVTAKSHSRLAGALMPIQSTCLRPRWSFVQFVDMLLKWHERARQRQALLVLNDHLLKDIGISHADAAHEASKPFWRP